MVLSIKRFFQRLINQLILKSVSNRLITFNLDKIHTESQLLSDQLIAYKDEVGLNIVLELLELRKNIYIIKAHTNPKEIVGINGCIQALSELSTYIHSAMLAKKEEAKTNQKPQIRGTIKRKVDTTRNSFI